MRVNFDIVGSSVDKSRAIYLNFLHVFRFNIESLVHASVEARSILTERTRDVEIEDRWGRVREIFEIIYRRTHYRTEEAKKRWTLISILTTASNSWRYIRDQPLPRSSFSLLDFFHFFRDIMLPLIRTRATTYDIWSSIDPINVIQIIINNFFQRNISEEFRSLLRIRECTIRLSQEERGNEKVKMQVFKK